jgi:anti-sigma B factor antagonist
LRKFAYSVSQMSQVAIVCPPKMAGKDFNLQAATLANGRTHVIEMRGPLTLSGVSRLREAVQFSTEPQLVLLMPDVPYVDSSGAGALVNVYVSCQRRGRKLGIVGVSPRVRDLMRITMVERLFTFYESVDLAVEDMRDKAADVVGFA